MAPALTDSGFLNDFHLKPTPVTANRARLHTATSASDWCSVHHGHFWWSSPRFATVAFMFSTSIFLLFEHFWLWVEFGTYDETAKVQLWRSYLSLCQNLNCMVFFCVSCFILKVLSSPCTETLLHLLVPLVVWFFSPFLSTTSWPFCQIKVLPLWPVCIHFGPWIVPEPTLLNKLWYL